MPPAPSGATISYGPRRVPGTRTTGIFADYMGGTAAHSGLRLQDVLFTGVPGWLCLANSQMLRKYAIRPGLAFWLRPPLLEIIRNAVVRPPPRVQPHTSGASNHSSRGMDVAGATGAMRRGSHGKYGVRGNRIPVC